NTERPLHQRGKAVKHNIVLSADLFLGCDTDLKVLVADTCKGLDPADHLPVQLDELPGEFFRLHMRKKRPHLCATHLSPTQKRLPPGTAPRSVCAEALILSSPK